LAARQQLPAAGFPNEPLIQTFSVGYTKKCKLRLGPPIAWSRVGKMPSAVKTTPDSQKGPSHVAE
jgi:hypothetical protein